MNVLLVLPAVAVILFQAGGPMMLLTQTSWMAQVQLVIAMPFLRNHARAYFSQAFDMRRQFLYEWTVNWRFVPEEVFLSRNFAIGLVVAHATLLVFFLTTRWLKPMGNSLRVAFHYLLEAPSEDARKLIESRLTPDFILTTILTANTIGMLCARTLHPQFFSWIAWATPYLLWRSKLNPALVYVLWLGQELAWNQFPSTDLSSKIVVGVLAVAVLEIWIATDDEKPAPKNIPPEVLDQVQRHKASRQKQATVQEVPKKDSHRKQVTFHADVKADK
ncbi:MAG: dolichyl-P-Man:Man(5)GlcNAc(2)-PP-dolichol alpha-1,3-mannosyltransferase [Alyxoria varia]|nr:MAG: dolichyl-P-Man:Man(5)GlcNAc(2)-PP-dolichol alpha-1,3-mannosyltransferase [Alyxoria varia]